MCAVDGHDDGLMDFVDEVEDRGLRGVSGLCDGGYGGHGGRCELSRSSEEDATHTLWPLQLRWLMMRSNMNVGSLYMGSTVR